MWWRIGGCLLLCGSFLTACDKGSDNTAPPNAPTGPATPVLVPIEHVRPTTQSLLSNWVSLNLKYGVPLSLMAPESWSVKSQTVAGIDGPQLFLEGPTLAGDVQFRIPTSRMITTDQEALLEVHANQSLAKNPGLLGTSVVRDIPGAKVIEQMSPRELMPTTEELDDQKGLPPSSTQPIETVQWTFTVCIPAGKGFTAYDLTVGLPLAQYKADHAFVRSIMNTLKYIPPAADPAPPSMH